MTLGSLADGACEELFQAALKRVLENIDDPNTHHKAKRQIRLSVTFEADEERKTTRVNVSCDTKLAGVRPASAVLFVGRRNGQLLAVEAYKQEALFPEDKPAGKLLELRQPKEED